MELAQSDDFSHSMTVESDFILEAVARKDDARHKNASGKKNGTGQRHRGSAKAILPGVTGYLVHGSYPYPFHVESLHCLAAARRRAVFRLAHIFGNLEVK